MSKTPDPKPTWWPNGFCSGWDPKASACKGPGGCICLPKKAAP